MAALRFKLIAAMCSNGGIGYKGGLPWPHCKADMAHFAQRTTGAGNNAVIMGRTTWDSIPMRPLKRRANLILSSHNSNNNNNNNNTNVEHWFSSMPDLFAHLESAKYDEVWIIGGARIYEQFMTMHANGEINIDEMCITTMEGTHECDTFFPHSMIGTTSSTQHNKPLHQIDNS
jgi:dihydrofolate reductase